MLDRGFELYVKRQESGAVGFEAFGAIVFGGQGQPDQVIRSVIALCEGSGDERSKWYYLQVLLDLVEELRNDLSEDVLGAVARCVAVEIGGDRDEVS